MKAVVLKVLNFPLEVSEVKTTELKFGQILTKNIISGLCGAQLQEISGNKGNAKFLPHLMGHEGCGIVSEIGPGVTKVKVGDKVVMHWMKGSGIESDFPKYVYNDKLISSGKVTTLNENSIVSENRVTVVPPNTNPEFCSLLGCGMTTSLGVVSREAQVQFGERVAVIGCGGVGLNMILAANLIGASEVHGFDIFEEKKELVEKVGGKLVMFSNSKYDVIIDTVGNNASVSRYSQMLEDGGRYIIVGQNKAGEPLSIPNSNSMFGFSGKTLKWTQGGRTNPDVDIPKYVALYEQGKININNIITHRFSLEEINKAFTILKSGLCGRIIINL